MKIKNRRADVMKGAVTLDEVLAKDLADPEARRVFNEHLLEAELAEKVCQIREKRKLTQEQLADRAGMKQHGISRIEKGSHSMTLATLQRVAGALGCRVEVRLVASR